MFKGIIVASRTRCFDQFWWQHSTVAVRHNVGAPIEHLRSRLCGEFLLHNLHDSFRRIHRQKEFIDVTCQEIFGYEAISPECRILHGRLHDPSVHSCRGLFPPGCCRRPRFVGRIPDPCHQPSFHVRLQFLFQRTVIMDIIVIDNKMFHALIVMEMNPFMYSKSFGNCLTLDSLVLTSNLSIANQLERFWLEGSCGGGGRSVRIGCWKAYWN